MNCRFVYLLLLFFVAMVACKSAHRIQSERRNIPVALHDGDIAFRCGRGFMSQIVLAANAEGSFSHVGVVCRVDGEWCVIHEVPHEGQTPDDDKIHCEKIEDFFDTQKASSGAIYRVEGLTEAQRARVCQYLLVQLLLDTPFDHYYDLEDDKRQYCTELVWRGYLTIGIDITKGSRTPIYIPGVAEEIILPSDIENNDELMVVYCFAEGD